MTVIHFLFDTSDYQNYHVFANNTKYEINADKDSISLKSNQKMHLKISYKQSPLTFIKILRAFFASLLQIPIFLLFDLTPENKWYKDISLYNFEYLFEIQPSNTESNYFQFEIHNTGKNVFVCEVNRSENQSAQLRYEELTKCYTNLKCALLKYIFRLTWIEVLLYAILFLCFHNNCIVMVTVSIVMILFYIILTVSSIKKYNTIKNSE